MPPPITDHLGRPIRLRLLATDRPRMERDESLSAERRERIDRTLRKVVPPPTTNDQFAVPAVFVVAFIAAAFVLLALGAPKLWGSPVAIMVGMVASQTYAGIRRRGLHSMHAPAIIDAFLAERCCPNCAYHLEGVEPGPDGLTICPECGAAWRLPPGATTTK